MKNVTFSIGRVGVLALGVAMGAALVGCDTGDAGKAKCLEMVDLWNACTDEADDLDPEESCNDDYFEAAMLAGCSWEGHFQSCIDSFQCDENLSRATCVFEGDCE